MLPRNFDVVHIDGGHGHDDVLHDLELCLPYADYLIVDDVNFATTVRSGVAEFLDRHPDVSAVRYDSWRGLVLIDARAAKQHHKVNIYTRYFQQLSNLAEAREVILNNDGGRTTDERWEHETPWLLERLVFPPGLLLDVGCAIGRLAGPLSRRHCQSVLGVDISEPMRRMAVEQVDNPERFAVTTPEFLGRLVASGLRFQGALAILVLQHVPADQLVPLVALLWQALEPDAPLFTLDRRRCIPISNGVGLWWANDRLDLCQLIESEGFSLRTEEEQGALEGTGHMLRCWIRRR
jgi:SAM-dependent methyltransferase